MKTTAVACNRCGAPLNVGEAARFVTCKHCDARLEIRQDDASAWTEVVGKIEQVEATRE